MARTPKKAFLQEIVEPETQEEEEVIVEPAPAAPAPTRDGMVKKQIKPGYWAWVKE